MDVHHHRRTSLDPVRRPRLSRREGLLVLALLAAMVAAPRYAGVLDAASFLHWAALHGTLLEIRISLALGQPADQDGGDTHSPFLLAVRDSRLDVVRLMLQQGSDPDQRDPRGRTALSLAVENRNQDMVRELLAAGAKPGIRDWGHPAYTPFHVAAESGDTGILRILLVAGPPPEPLSKEDVLDSWHYEGEVWVTAVRNGRMETFDLLVPRGSSDSSHVLERALLEAAGAGQVAALRNILDRGVEVDSAAANNRETALHRAAEGGHPDVMNVLVERGADLEARDSVGETPLFRTVGYRAHLEAARWLIRAGARTDVVSTGGATLLHDAVYASSSLDRASLRILVALLVEAGVKTDAVDGWGQTALERARRWERHEMVAILEELVRGPDGGGSAPGDPQQGRGR